MQACHPRKLATVILKKPVDVQKRTPAYKLPSKQQIAGLSVEDSLALKEQIEISLSKRVAFGKPGQFQSLADFA